MRPQPISPELLNQILSQHIRELFWTKVKKGHPDECWPWTAGLDCGGYGKFSVTFLGKSHSFKASRIALVYEHNRDIEHGKLVLHSCIANRKCCNPKHLRAGTQLENIREMIQQGRKVAPRGEDNGYSKLTTEKVIEIRALHALGNLSTYDLAPLFGVNRATISRVVNRKIWTHI